MHSFVGENQQQRQVKRGRVDIAKPPLKIIGFCCQNALGREKDLAAKGRGSFEPTIKIVALPCSSKVEPLAIIKAFESGAEGIFVLGCPEGRCHLLGGNDRARRIVNYTKRLLGQIGIESSRLEMFQFGMAEGEHFDQVARTMTKRIESLKKA